MQKHIHKLTKIHQKNDKIWQKMQKKAKTKQEQDKNWKHEKNMKKRKIEINWDNLSWKIFLNTKFSKDHHWQIENKNEKKEKSR